MSPAQRVAGMALSPIRRMAVGAPEGTVSLGLGEPGWPAPAVAREALARLADADGALPYGPNAGDPRLVDAIARHHGASVTTGPEGVRAGAGPEGVRAGAGPEEARAGGPDVDPHQVMVTSGSQAALFALFQAHVEPGSAVLVPDPGFVSYVSLARLCGAVPVGYPLGPGGELDAELLAASLAAAPHTSLVVLNHPANPTGGTASPAALARVAEVCAAAGVLLVSDEVYRELYVDERPPSLHGVAGLGAGVVLGSMSKAFGAPGLRVGWAVGDPAVLGPARIVHNAMTTAAAVPSQVAALALLGEADRVLAVSRRHVRRRWELLEARAPELLTLAAGGSAAPPRGRAGIYLWLPVPEAAGVETETVAGGADPTLAFALRLRDEGGVTTVPGSAFGPRGAGFLRVSLGGPQDELEEGLRRLAPWWKA